jgi:NosR/NirI family nitrous oxide reductase transcriptional regulator
MVILVSPSSDAFAAATAPEGGTSRLDRYLSKIDVSKMVPGADRVGTVEGTPPAAPVYSGDRRVGYLLLNSDIVNATGYSGKPINVVVGLDNDGFITGAKLVEHHEPIVLIGIPEQRVVDFIDQYRGKSVLEFADKAGREAAPADIVSGATVTVMIIDDTIKRAALKFARSRGLGGVEAITAELETGPRKTVDMSRNDVEDWVTLLGDGSVRRLRLSLADVNGAFEELGDPKAIARAEKGDPDETFIDLFVALATIPTIGRSLLGDSEYENMKKRLKPGQQAILVAANGRFSFKGSGYVRGGIFDRIQVIQDGNSVRFRDRGYKRIGEFRAKHAPRLREIGLFLVPEGVPLDPAAPWRLQLLVPRAVGPLDKVFTTFDLRYIPPDRYLKAAPPPPPVQTQAREEQATGGQGVSEDEDEPLWMRIWRGRVVDIAVLVFALGVLTAIFFFQNVLARRPDLTDWVRTLFLFFVVFWLGYHARAQLSVVNVLTFGNALLTDFRWDYFLMEPLIFILWVAVACSMIFWGRGVFCGWLCPFGALQELLNKLAKTLRVPQLRVPWGLHERMWPAKYIVFVGLFGLSFYSFAWAEQGAEIEPFKTAIILNFMREWPFVVYAGLLLVVGLFIERFFCRYLCPLGAALAIPGRLRTFEWLRRYKECGSPCQRCANDCMVQAIHPEGHINPNECLYCLNCQVLYYDDHRCPVVIAKRLKSERRQALSAGRAGRKAGTPALGQPAAAGPAAEGEEAVV